METSYTVTEADILAGSVVNHAAASGVSPDPEAPEVPVTPDEAEVKTENKNGHISLTKQTVSAPANGSTYALGETIDYEIRAVNDGNLTLTDIVVEDALTGGRWTIAELKPGQQSAAMHTSYTVTEADVLAGGVANVATAGGVSPDPETPEVPVTPGEKDEPVSVADASLFVEKRAGASADGGTYGLGEQVTYTIDVTNNGNVTVSDITVTDELTGESWKIDSLAPNAKQSFTTVYTVTEADIRAGQVVNVAAVHGTDPNGNPVDADGTETITADPVDTSLDVVKTVVNPQAEYRVGDTISYQIAVSNRGNVTLRGVRVTDTLMGTDGKVTFTDLAGGTLDNGDVILAELGAGETITLSCQYTVAEGDVNASVRNQAQATPGEGDNGPITDITDATPVEQDYSLRIHYVSAEGA